jgi:quinol-cytochrome oxidoreductase complex cytochrome b subunit
MKAWGSEIGRSFFPSMGWADWRSVLRGDAAPRPNPRMRVHNNSFWYHIRPRALAEEATAWYYTMGLGWMSFFFFVLESITGAVLMIFYVPSATEAYPSMLQIMGDVPLGNLMRNLHRLGAHFMVAIVFLHMMRTYFTASYKAPRQFIWFTGVLLCSRSAATCCRGTSWRSGRLRSAPRWPRPRRWLATR